jgi:bacillolysin
MKNIKKSIFLSLLLVLSFNTIAIESLDIVSMDEKNIPTKVELKSKSFMSQEAIQALKYALPMNQNDTYELMYQKDDEKGMNHQRFQQYYKGLKVEFANYIIHSTNGKITSLNGDFISTDKLVLEEKLNPNEVINIAKALSGAKQFRWEDSKEENMLKLVTQNENATYQPIAEKVIISDFYGNNNARLAYKVSIYSLVPFGAFYYYIDAQNGKLLYKHPILLSANAETRYSGTRQIETSGTAGAYVLKDFTRGGSIETYNCKKGTNTSTTVTFTDADNNWTSAEYNNTTKDNAALDAHWGAEKTYDYWKNIHGRNSYDGNNTKIKSFVHYSSALENAYWDDAIGAMVYGDGGSSFDALTSLDVCGHEIGHGICSNTANLLYQSEPGALNEALSDIWGACIENYAAPEKSIWLIGEDIDKRTGHDGLRSMSNPNKEAQPDTYRGQKWASTASPSVFNDYGGVHTNSGVMNFWFYLTSVGGTGTNDKGFAYNVSGIGIDKAQRIVWRAEDVYMTSSNKYLDARTHTIQAAKDLYGVGSPEEIAVTNAWYAVYVGSAYQGGSSCGTVTNLVVSNISTTSAGVSFTAVAGATSYLVEYKLSMASSWITLYNNTNTAGNLGGLVACNTYNVRVTTYCGINVSTAATTTFTTGGCSCPVPTNVASTKLTPTSFKITWSAMAGATSYNLRKKKTTASTWTNFTGITTTRKTIAASGAGSTYEVQVQSVCANGSTSDWATAINVFPTGLVASESDPSLLSKSKNIGFEVFPNPANNELFIVNNSNEKQLVQINIYEVSGKNLLNKNIDFDGTEKIDISFLNHGMYILQITKDNLVIQSVKIIKN